MILCKHVAKNARLLSNCLSVTTNLPNVWFGLVWSGPVRFERTFFALIWTKSYQKARKPQYVIWFWFNNRFIHEKSICLYGCLNTFLILLLWFKNNTSTRKLLSVPFFVVYCGVLFIKIGIFELHVIKFLQNRFFAKKKRVAEYFFGRLYVYSWECAKS